MTQKQKWTNIQVQTKTKRVYNTKAKKLARKKKEWGILGICLGLAVVIILGYGNVDEGEISRNLHAKAQSGINYQLDSLNASESQILSEKGKYCVELTPEQQIIKEVANMREFKDIELLFCLAKHESHYRQYKIGVNLHYQENGEVWATKDRGIFQINSYWHDEVSDECTMDIACSTNETISILNNDGNCEQWATCKYCK